MGVVVSERSKVMRVEPGAPLRIVTEFAELRADQAVIALNGYAPQLGFFRNRLTPALQLRGRHRASERGTAGQHRLGRA